MPERLARWLRRAQGLEAAPASSTGTAALFGEFAVRVIQGLEEGVMVFSAAGRLLFWNPAAARILERDLAATADGDATPWVMLREDGARMGADETPLARALVQRIALKAEVLGYLTPSGALRWLQVSAEPAPAAAGIAPAVVLTLSDVTTLRRTEHERRLQQEHQAVKLASSAHAADQARADFRALIEAVPLPVCAFSRDGSLVRANAQFWSTFGHAEGSLRSLEDWWQAAFPDPGERREVVRAWLDLHNAVPDAAGERRSVHRISCASGERRMVELTSVPLHDGLLAIFNPIGQAGVGRLQAGSEDLARVQAEAQRLREDKRLAEDANRVKSAFLASVSHEIRNPLNAIMGMAEVLKDERLDMEQRGLVETISAAGRSLLDIVNDILDFAKIEAGRMAVESQPFALPQLLQQILQLWLPTAERKGLRLELAPLPPLPALVLGDAQRLGQILSNLISNAIKFTDHGEVRLAVECPVIAAGPVQLTFRIRDTGRGIPPEKQALIFEPFTQLDVPGISRGSGTGLGLAISRELAILLGGTLAVSSQPGGGSEFRLDLHFLPVDPDAAPVPAQEGADEGPGGDTLLGVHLMVVDDNPVNLEVASRLMAREGAQVTSVAGGQAALNWLLEHKDWPQVILMDVQMPDMDGLEATRRILALPGGQALRILALSAGTLPHQRALALQAGMLEFIAKPFTVQDMLAAVQRSLAMPLPRSEEAAADDVATDGSAPEHQPAQAEARSSADAPLAAPAGTPTDVPEDQAAAPNAPASAAADSPSAMAAFPPVRGHDAELAFQRLQGDRELYLRSLRLFDLELVRLNREVSRHLEQANPFLLGRHLHRLKGAAAMVGATALADAAARLEEMTVALGTSPAVSPVLRGTAPQLHAALADLLADCESHRRAMVEDLRALRRRAEDAAGEPAVRAPARPEAAGLAFSPELQRKLAALAEQLERRDLAAFEAFRVLQPELARRLSGRSLHDLRQSMEVLAFARAAALLRECLSGR